MTVEPGRGGNRWVVGVPEGLLYFLLPVVIALATGRSMLREVLAGGLVNPDSYMRLVRIEQMLRQHGVAYVVDRDGSGAGALLHWSHLLDSLLCVMAAPFALVLHQQAALHMAAALCGPLSLGVLGLALAWAAAPLADRRWLWLAPMAGALPISIVAYGLPGVAHHHVMLVVIAVMVGGYALRAALGVATARAGLAIGAWAGMGIWLSPESMPFSLMAFGGMWLVWLSAPERRDVATMIRTTGLSFLLVVGCAFAVDPPYAGYGAVVIDRVSIVYVALALVVGAMACACWFIDRMKLRQATQVAAALVLAAVGLGLWLALFPTVIRGPDGLMTARQTQEFLGSIREMQPAKGLMNCVEWLLTGSLTALVLIWLAVSRRSLLLGYAALCALAMVAIGALHARFAAYAGAAGAVMLPVLLTCCTQDVLGWREASMASVRIALFTVFLLAPRAESLPGLASSAKAANAEPVPDCSVSFLAPMLEPYAGQVILAHVNDTPELLYRTRLLTVASLYHRNLAAFLRWRAAWFSHPSDTVPGEVRQTGASLVLFCARKRGWTVRDAELPTDSLAARMQRGEIPPWLHELYRDPASGNVLYGIAAAN